MLVGYRKESKGIRHQNVQERVEEFWGCSIIGVFLGVIVGVLVGGVFKEGVIAIGHERKRCNIEEEV